MPSMPVMGSNFALRIVVACAALLAAAGQATVTGDFAGLVDVGHGRKMYLEFQGTGSPTVVLVAGLKASAGDWNIANTNSGHEIHKEQPRLVIDANREVVDAVHNPSSWRQRLRHLRAGSFRVAAAIIENLPSGKGPPERPAPELDLVANVLV